MCLSQAKAQQIQTEDTGDLVLKSYPGNKDAIFKGDEPVLYELTLKNNTGSLQKGRISYIVTTDKGVKVASGATSIALKGKDNQSITIRIPTKPTGFYRVNFMINTPDYDDTVRRVFGVNPTGVHSELHRPADFDEFWARTRQDLEKIAPAYKITERKDLSNNHKKVFFG